jgi:hypothetical protein
LLPARAQPTVSGPPAPFVDLAKIRSITDAKQFAEDTIAAVTASSQLLVSAQQVKVATILARAENSDVLVLGDLVSRNYLRSVPIPYSGETAIDGPLLELAPVTAALCQAMERKAGRTGLTVPTMPGPELYGCYVAGGRPVVFYRL